MSVALFDLDGTLTDPKEGITRSVQYALRAHGIDVADLDTLVQYIGPPLRESFITLGQLSEADATRAVGRYREYFSDTGIFQNRVYPGIPECLGKLKACGWRLAVATSKPTVFAERILEHFSLRQFFELVAGSELDGSRVHKHEVIAYALDAMSVPPDRACVMIGDREHDVIGAIRVGLTAIGVAWGYGGRSELSIAGAHHIVESVEALAAAVESLREDSLREDSLRDDS